SAAASMRAGAGYVTACVPASEQRVIASGGLPELMTRALPDDGAGLLAEGVAAVLDAAERGGALALGPGLGRQPGAVAFARALAREAQLPLVLDADGLNAHAGCLEDLAARRAPTVLTPHAGELARLLALDSAEIERERLRHVRAASAAASAVVVLKGDDTLVADSDGRVAVSPGGSPALATAGTGDVLTGVIAALLAQQLDPFAAAAAGVWLHAAAGREAARALGAAEGVVASDVIAALPAARWPGEQAPAR
ncbi:MAG TPA: NAD(P)H-hydrate dehydratase, partial [Solirubrobacteraceae bacterium]|nr:NAD(P)H-hydrate dehydratase [Solirubrobacteraceae bacterium]